MNYKNIALKKFKSTFKNDSNYKYKSYKRIDDYAMRVFYEFKGNTYNITYRID